MYPSKNADQANGLRSKPRRRKTQVMAFTGGKGGIGKSTVTLNTAVSLAEAGHKVLVLDGDLGLANIDVLLGLHPEKNLSHVIAGECSLQDILLEGPGGILIIPASSGVHGMSDLSSLEQMGLVRAFSELSCELDYLLVDTAAGVSNTVLTFASAAQEIVVVLCDEPAAITDAYAAIKLLHREHRVDRFRVLVNMATSEQQAQTLFQRLVKVTDKYLDVILDYMGAIPLDAQVRKAVASQRSVVSAYPQSEAAHAFKKIGKRIERWPVASGDTDHISFFVEKNARGISVYEQFSEEAQHLDRLVRDHAPLVKRIAQHLIARLPSSVQIDDLIQAGMMGLLEAARNYDATKGASFETYAGIRIKGNMLDEVRRADWVPRSVHKNSRRISQAIRDLEHRLGRDARDTEVAEALGCKLTGLPSDAFRYPRFSSF